ITAGAAVLGTATVGAAAVVATRAVAAGDVVGDDECDDPEHAAVSAAASPTATTATALAFTTWTVPVRPTPRGPSRWLPRAEDARQQEQHQDGDELAADDDPVDVDGGLPADGLALYHVDAGRLGDNPETASGAGSRGTRRLPRASCPLALAAPCTAADR